MHPRLGRLHAPDARDRDFLMRGAIPDRSTRNWRNWYAYKVHLDQGMTPSCVGNSWTHFLTDSPRTHTFDEEYALELYFAAQEVDEWPGFDYDGTSVRAGAKVLQARGLIGPYLWAYDVDTVVRCLLEQGPVVVGTNFYDGMERPELDENGRPWVKPTGVVVGGHAYKLDGVNVPHERIRMKNSWGTGWGHNGFAFLSFATLEKLLAEDGEACLALEVSA